MDSPNTATEREIKLRIDGRDDYRRLAGVLPVPRRWGMQLNAYLDTPDSLLRNVRTSLRVRITPDHARLTMKSPWSAGFLDGSVVVTPAGFEPVTGHAHPDPRAVSWERDSSGAFVHRETEVQIDRALAIRWICDPSLATPWLFEGFEGLRDQTGDGGLRLVCWSLTRRAICDVPEGLTIELDETVFPDGFRDFEVELEHPDSERALKVIMEYAAGAGISLHHQEFSKHARARAHAGRLDWVIPSGASTDAQPPLFMEPAPTGMFNGCR
ncbi:MAG TPA: CYTH domain-containing protein [Myxococcota bacterium]|nr:CYTH domain-containing protein [Myxococcota bacterium]HOA14508.1 CYTH domain-containing protein [Myxococcota bacterium]HOD00409.1 CYTH domain-containing protein [Myxococcota bacterium]HOH77817.1 CYTH domain-containing protein [Myxococcota bacterium]HPV04521.1 CYTH domain-containing protein [Myxococcota bacterium]